MIKKSKCAYNMILESYSLISCTVGDAAVSEVLQGPPKKVEIGQESRTVFVSNLNYATSIEAVTAVFENCGPIKEARLVKDFKGRSKGFGFVVFENLDSMPKALERDRTPIGTRPMFVSTYEPNKEGHAFKYSTGAEKDKLFVRGLPFSMSEMEIREAFEVHAPVSEIRLVTHRNGYSKGTCFIKFADASTAESVRQKMDQTELRGFTITVLISDPSAPKRERTINKMSALSRNTEAVGTRKPTLAFVPRALAKVPPPKASAPTSVKVGDDKEDNPKIDVKVEGKSNDDFRQMLLKK